MLHVDFKKGPDVALSNLGVKGHLSQSSLHSPHPDQLTAPPPPRPLPDPTRRDRASPLPRAAGAINASITPITARPAAGRRVSSIRQWGFDAGNGATGGCDRGVATCVTGG